MQTYEKQLAAGEAWELKLPPQRLFTLLKTDAPVDVEIAKDVYGGGMERAVGVEGGFMTMATTDAERFQYVKIISATAQAVKVGVSVRNVDNTRIAGEVSIAGEVNAVSADSPFKRVMDAKSYIGHFRILQEEVSGKWPMLRLRNPGAGSPFDPFKYRLFVVSRISFWAEWDEATTLAPSFCLHRRYVAPDLSKTHQPGFDVQNRKQRNPAGGVPVAVLSSQTDTPATPAEDPGTPFYAVAAEARRKMVTLDFGERGLGIAPNEALTLWPLTGGGPKGIGLFGQIEWDEIIL